MKLCYIAGKYTSPTIRGTVLNIRKAEETAIMYWHLGYAVICPHLNTALLDGEDSTEMFMQGDFEMIRRCDTVIFLKGWEDSKGSVREHALAKELNKEIIYD